MNKQDKSGTQAAGAGVKWNSNRFRAMSQTLSYSLKSRAPWVTLVAFVILLIVFWVYVEPRWLTTVGAKGPWFDTYGHFIDPLITVLTLIVAVSIGAGSRYRQWIESLPKKLTVTFQHGGKEIMICELAYLGGESDIRPWGQQLGQQMVAKIAGDEAFRLLKMSPHIGREQPRRGYSTDFDGFFLEYRVTFYLVSCPFGNLKDENGVNMNGDDGVERIFVYLDHSPSEPEEGFILVTRARVPDPDNGSDSEWPTIKVQGRRQLAGEKAAGRTRVRRRWVS